MAAGFVEFLGFPDILQWPSMITLVSSGSCVLLITCARQRQRFQGCWGFNSRVFQGFAVLARLRMAQMMTLVSRGRCALLITCARQWQDPRLGCEGSFARTEEGTA